MTGHEIPGIANMEEGDTITSKYKRQAKTGTRRTRSPKTVRWGSLCKTIVENSIELCGFYQIVVKKPTLLKELKEAFENKRKEIKFFEMLSGDVVYVSDGLLKWGDYMKVDQYTFVFRFIDVSASPLHDIHHTISDKGMLTGWCYRFEPDVVPCTGPPPEGQLEETAVSLTGFERESLEISQSKTNQSIPVGEADTIHKLSRTEVQKSQFVPSRVSAFAPPSKRSSSVDVRPSVQQQPAVTSSYGSYGQFQASAENRRISQTHSRPQFAEEVPQYTGLDYTSPQAMPMPYVVGGTNIYSNQVPGPSYGAFGYPAANTSPTVYSTAILNSYSGTYTIPPSWDGQRQVYPYAASSQQAQRGRNAGSFHRSMSTPSSREAYGSYQS